MSSPRRCMGSVFWNDHSTCKVITDSRASLTSQIYSCGLVLQEDVVVLVYPAVVSGFVCRANCMTLRRFPVLSFAVVRLVWRSWWVVNVLMPATRATFFDHVQMVAMHT